MPYKHSASRRYHTLLRVLSHPEVSFKVRIWLADEVGLCRRGSLTLLDRGRSAGMLAAHWTERAGSVCGPGTEDHAADSGHPDQPDGARALVFQQSVGRHGLRMRQQHDLRRFDRVFGKPARYPLDRPQGRNTRGVVRTFVMPIRPLPSSAIATSVKVVPISMPIRQAIRAASRPPDAQSPDAQIPGAPTA
jgi:hypothetical protein